MNYVNNGPRNVGGTIDSLDYFVWALAAVHSKPSPRYNLDLLDPVRQRIAQIAMNATEYVSTELLQLETLLCYADITGAELRLHVESRGSNARRRTLLVSQQVRALMEDQGTLCLDVRFVFQFIRDLCAGTSLDELAWGAEMEPNDLRDVLCGRRTVIEEISRVCAAAGYELRLWLMYKGIGVGTTKFCKRFPHASREAFASRTIIGSTHPAYNAEILAILLGNTPLSADSRKIRRLSSRA